MDDLVNKGALVYDGTGVEPAIKDVAVSAHKIRRKGEVGQNFLKTHIKSLTAQVWH